MNLYLDASAAVKAYVDEAGSDVVARSMLEADAWFMCRIGYVEMCRAIGLAAGPIAVARFIDDWPAFVVVEVDQRLAERAAALADAGLRSMDALHLAAALLLPRRGLVLATWDRRLHGESKRHGVDVIPERLA